MSKKKNYDNWSKEELIKELERIKETKYGLIWHRDKEAEEKLEVLINVDAKTPRETFSNEVSGKPFPVLKEVKDKQVLTNKKKPVNLLIEGDNYHSLAVLNFTHQEAIDFIYIDPPPIIQATTTLFIMTKLLIRRTHLDIVNGCLLWKRD
jgi:adenine-specific DNA-methyltransferase